MNFEFYSQVCDQNVSFPDSYHEYRCIHWVYLLPCCPLSCSAGTSRAFLDLSDEPSCAACLQKDIVLDDTAPEAGGWAANGLETEGCCICSLS